MARATKADKARFLNAAYRLLGQADGTRRGGPAARSRVRVVASAGVPLSPEGRRAERSRCRRSSRTVAITFKLPVSTVRAIRAYARRSGLSLGQVVTQAVSAFLDTFRQPRG